MGLNQWDSTNRIEPMGFNQWYSTNERTEKIKKTSAWTSVFRILSFAIRSDPVETVNAIAA